MLRLGRVSPTKAEHVLASLDGRIALVIDDGPTSAGVESTIARVRDGAVEILRPGPVTADMLGAGSGLAAGGGADGDREGGGSRVWVGAGPGTQKGIKEKNNKN